MNRHTNTFWAAVLSAFVVFGLAASRGLAEEADSPGVLAVSVLRTLREDPASIVGMSEAELILTCRALVGAGGREAAGLICATWVEGSDKYKSSSTDTLCQLATFSRMAAEAGQAAVQRVAGHVQEVYLAQPDATRSVKPGQWQALTGVLAAGLSEGSRASWAASLRAAFVEDGGVLAGLKLADVQTLSGALAALGDQQPHRPVTAWVETTTAWQALKPGDLVSLSRSLAAAKETGQAALQQVASHVEQTYTADAAAMKSVSLGDWRNLTGVLAGKMSEESRERLSGHLLAAYVDNGEALQGLKVGDVQALSGALAALGDQQPHRPVTAWVETTTAWQTLNPAELVSLAGSLASAKEQGQSARQHLASHVESTCLANPDVVRSVPLNCWRDLAVRLAQDLPDENRGRWMSTLRATFTEAAGAFETLMLGDVQALTAALKSLGDAQADSVPPAWVERTKGWKALDQKGLISLASSLAASKEAGQVARQRVAAHVQEQFLPSIEATRSVSSSEWGEFAGRLGADLSEENRTVWANGLRAAYVQNAETFAGLKLADVQGLSRALSSLGEENAVAVVALWVDQTAGWRDLKPPDLVSLAGTLAAVKEEGASARQRLASHLETAYLADAAATRSVSAAQWRDLASRLVPDLSEEKRSAWAAGLRAAYVQDAEVLAAQKLDDVLGLGDALKALGDKQAQEPLATWVQATTVWRSLKPNELASKLASRLTTDTEAGRAARECLVAHVESTYLADAVRAVGGGQWKELMGHVAKWLSDERRAAWAAQLRAACVEDTGVLAAMELGGVQDLSAVLKSLGDKEADAVAAVWAESTSAWQEYAPNALASLANSLLAAGDAGRSVRQRLAAHVQQRYLSTPEAAREIGSAAWRELVAPLRQDLTSESRIEWAQRIRDAYGGSEAVLVGLNLGELEALCKALGALGDAHGPYLVARYVERSTDWRLWEKPSDLLRLLQLLSGSGANLKTARLRVAEFLAEAHLADPQKAHELGPAFWQRVAQLAGEDFSPEDRQAWYARIRQAFAETDEALAAMKAAEFEALVKSLMALDKKEAAGLVRLWLTQGEGWRQARPVALAALVHVLAQQDPDALKPLIEGIEQHFVAVDGQEPVDLSTIGHLMQIHFALGNADKAQAWVLRAYAARVGTEKARSTVDMNSLRMLTEYLWLAGLVKDRAYPAYAMALARHAREGTLDASMRAHVTIGSEGLHYPEFLAFALGADEARAILEAELLDAQGNPRQGVAKVLAWVFRIAGKIESWRDFTDTKIAATDGDTKALWLAVKAYNETLVPDPPNPVRRKSWLSQALASAVSDEAKMVVLYEFGDLYRSIQRPGVGVTMLESVKGQLGPEARAGIQTTIADLQRRETDRAIQEIRLQSAIEMDHKEGLLKYYRRCLEQAQAESEHQEVAKLQQAVEELERERNP